MKIIQERVYSGPNIYAYKPVIRLRIDLSPWHETTTAEIPNFCHNLAELLPGLSQHHCSRGRAGGFLERVAEGTYLGHVIEHVALELSTMSGQEVFFGTTRAAEQVNIYDVVYAYETLQVGLEAGRFATGLVEALAAGNAAGQMLPQMLAELKAVSLKFAPGPSAKALLGCAKARRIPILPLAGGAAVQLGYGANSRRLAATITGNTSALAVDLACDKWATRCLLSESGLPIPAGTVAASWEEVERAVRFLGFPIVIKPVSANQGKGVTSGIHSLEAAQAAWQLASSWGNVLVEKQVPGQDWRLLVVEGKFAAASLRRPPAVSGDGKSTLGELIARLNEDELRGEGHEKPLTKVPLDEVTIVMLKAQGYNLNSVPAAGVRVQLRQNGNLSTGGVAADATELVHPQNRELAERAARLLGLDVAGVDLICEDIAFPLTEQQGAIIEVNAAPGLRMHLYPSAGEARPVAQEIVSHLFPTGQGRIPLIAVTGTNGKTTTVRMLGHVLSKQGLFVGQTTTDGIYLGGQLAVPGDNTGPWSAQAVLRDPKVEAAVLEVARGGILRGGLGYDLSQVAVITNLSEDHLGLGGIETIEDLAQVKSLVAECVLPGGWVVLNADDPHVAAMAQRVSPDVNILYFSAGKNNRLLKNHLATAGSALHLDGEKIVWHSAGASGRFLAPIASYPATLSGEVAHNVANLLAAMGAALALGLAPFQIEEALLTFPSDSVCNPGRFNIFELGSKKVIVDYGHNPAGYSTTLLAAKKLTGSLLGVVGAPGDRRDETIRSMGEIAARFCQHLIIKEDQDLRGREKGEVARLLQEGALAAGMPADKIQIIYDEVEALHNAVSEHAQDVIIFYESWARVHKEIALLSAAGFVTPREHVLALKSEAK
jgi:cyanophycin synthetase